jgi:hypothetical protein
VPARRELSSGELFDGQIGWTTTAVDVLETDEIAIQVLNHLRVAVRYSMMRDARLLWARTPEAAVDFVAGTVEEYLDFQPYLAQYDRELFRQAASGTLAGRIARDEIRTRRAGSVPSTCPAAPPTTSRDSPEVIATAATPRGPSFEGVELLTVPLRRRMNGVGV